MSNIDQIRANYRPEHRKKIPNLQGRGKELDMSNVDEISRPETEIYKRDIEETMKQTETELIKNIHDYLEEITPVFPRQNRTTNPTPRTGTFLEQSDLKEPKIRLKENLSRIITQARDAASSKRIYNSTKRKTNRIRPKQQQKHGPIYLPKGQELD